VTLSRRFSVTQHVVNLLAACAQSLYALRTLRHHGLNSRSIQAIFQATVVSKLTYASPAWWGFASATDRSRLEAFLHRSAGFGYRSASDPSLASLCDEIENKLFADITANTRHLLYPLLPPLRDSGYDLRKRAHDYQLPERSTALKNNNFLMRNLYKNMCSSQNSTA